MAERSFYCPCDNFNLFDNANYDLELNRDSYCKMPMSKCVERFFFKKEIFSFKKEFIFLLFFNIVFFQRLQIQYLHQIIKQDQMLHNKYNIYNFIIVNFILNLR